MDNKKRNVQVESDGSRSAPVPLWQELPQITVPVLQFWNGWSIAGIP